MFGVSDTGLFLQSKRKSVFDIVSKDDSKQINLYWKAPSSQIRKPSNIWEGTSRASHPLLNKKINTGSSRFMLYLSTHNIISTAMIRTYDSFNNSNGTIALPDETTWSGGVIILEAYSLSGYKIDTYEENTLLSTVTTTYDNTQVEFYQILNDIKSVMIISKTNTSQDEIERQKFLDIFKQLNQEV